MSVSVPLRDVCKGRWQAILPHVGVNPDFLTGKHGPCPMCGGKDRFRFDDKEGRGSWICSQCGAGDGIDLAMRFNSWGFKEAAEAIEPLAGSVRPTRTRRATGDAALKEAMNGLWRSGLPVRPGDPVALYLERRGISLRSYPPALRFVERCRYQDGIAHWYPAMVAKVTAPDDKPSTIHRTYLGDDGRKASVKEPRKLMPGTIAKGAAIRLADAGPVLGIAEGIETALSAGIIWQVPCWASVSSGMMIGWEPPIETKEVIIFADNDTRYGGQMAAFSLAHRLAAARPNIKVRVEMPPNAGMDWNDVLQAERSAA